MLDIMYGYIYIIKNNINNKLYVGQTNYDPDKRWKNHLSMLRNNIHDNQHLQNAYNKYGENVFTFEIVGCAINQEYLDKLEIDYIDTHKCLDRNYGYNMLPGGLNSKHSEETKNKISKALTGKIRTPQHRENISKSRRGRTPWNKNKKHRKETCRKMSDALAGDSFGFKGTYYKHKHIKPWLKVWVSTIRYNSHRTYLGCFNDPLSPSFIYEFVKDEIY